MKLLFRLRLRLRCACACDASDQCNFQMGRAAVQWSRRGGARVTSYLQLQHIQSSGQIKAALRPVYRHPKRTLIYGFLLEGRVLRSLS